MKKSSRLTTAFYRNFLLFIMVPIFLVIVIALGIIRNMMLESAYETIEMAQETTAATIANEIKVNSLKLTHFLLTNDQQALELADGVANSTGQEKYQHTVRLKELYNFVVTPSSDIIAIHFYTKDGQTISLKDDLALPLDIIRKYDFYCEALEHPGNTSYGLINATFTYKTMQTEPAHRALAISFSPSEKTQMGSIETVCWYTYSSINRIITDYSRDAMQGEMYLVDGEGNVLVAPLIKNLRYTVPQDIAELSLGRHKYSINGTKRNVIISEVPGTDWRVVNLVDNGVLLAEFNKVSALVMVTSYIIFVLFIIYSITFLRSIIRPVNMLIAGMKRVESGDLNTSLEPIGQSEIRALMNSFNRMIQRTKQLVASNKAQQKQKMIAEMQALQSQINPHFLVNMLNSIRFTAMVSRFDNIKNMAEALIKILSASFKDPGSVYTIKEELETLKSYIYLMKIRYSENFDVHWDIDETCLSYSIPRLLIQPVVENAITHGFEDKEEPGVISIAIKRHDQTIQISVTDDGKGMEPTQVKALLEGTAKKSRNGHGIGIANINRRIKLNYGDAYGLTIESREAEGSTFVLTIPVKKEED